MDLIERVFSSNKERDEKNQDLSRRVIKLAEEVGEVSQAYFSLTSKRNKKNKTWDDVREELADVVLIALDLLVTEMPDEELDADGIKERTVEVLKRKIKAKWN